MAGGWLVIVRLLPFVVVWFGLDVALLASNPDVGGAAGAGVSIGIGLAALSTARKLARYGQRQSVVIVSEVPRLYGIWRGSGTILRARRAT
jgi:hypothetical protein